jgi:hypothetical protein
MTEIGELDANVSSQLVAAMESVWTAARLRHPEIPSVVIVVASGGRSKNGHFASRRWVHGGDGGAEVHEVMVSGEGLARGAVAVFGTLVHEAAHALADKLDIPDTSNRGRYHNSRFKSLAESLGLEISKAPGIGWSVTSVPDATQAEYASEIEALNAALVLFRRHDLATSSADRNNAKASCECARNIRVAAGVLAAGPIICGLCDGEFKSD